MLLEIAIKLYLCVLDNRNNFFLYIHVNNIHDPVHSDSI